jgi:hypothetical protein
VLRLKTLDDRLLVMSAGLCLMGLIRWQHDLIWIVRMCSVFTLSGPICLGVVLPRQSFGKPLCHSVGWSRCDSECEKAKPARVIVLPVYGPAISSSHASSRRCFQ